MALKAIVNKDEFQALPELLRKEYVEREGAYWLEVTATEFKGGDGKTHKAALEDVTGLKDALSKERTNVEQLTAQVKRFEGIEDPKAALDAIAKVKEWGTANPDEKIKRQIEATTAQLEARYRNEIEALNKKLKDGQSELTRAQTDTDRLVLDSAASAALSKLEVLPEAHDLLVREIRQASRAKRVEVNGEVRHQVEVLDTQGNVRITSKSNSTDPMTVDELAAEMKAGRYAFGFKATQAAGGGGSNAGGKRAYAGQDLTKLSGPQLMEAGRKP